MKKKERLLYVQEYLRNETDEMHPGTVKDIMIFLESNNQERVDRRSIYNDIRILKKHGMDIIKERRGNEVVYYYAGSEFDTVDIRILIDFLKSSRVFTKNKIKDSIFKLSKLVNVHEREYLLREVENMNKIRVGDKSIHYNIDKVYRAMNENKKISFSYMKWNIEKNFESKNPGELYCISPWDLIWDNERYYCIGYDDNHREIRHYRVDKLSDVSILDFEREGSKIYQEYNASELKRSVFGMFGGDKTKVTIKAKNELVGVFIDHFGKDIQIDRIDDDSFVVEVEIVVCEKFYGWVFGIGNGVEIIGPELVVEGMKKSLKERLTYYERQ